MNEMTAKILKEITKAKKPKKQTMKMKVKRTISLEEKIVRKIEKALKDGGF